MTEQDDRQTGMGGGDAAIERPQVVDAQTPAVALGEEAVIVGAGAAAMAAAVVGDDAEAGAIERLGEAGVALGMFDQPVGDLHHRPSRRVRQPRRAEQPPAVARLEQEFRRRHPFPPRSPPARPPPICGAAAAGASLR